MIWFVEFKCVGTETGFCSKVSNFLTSNLNFFVCKGVEESKQTVPFQDDRLMIDGVKIDMSTIPFHEPQIALLLFFPVFFAPVDEFCLCTLLRLVFVFPVVVLREGLLCIVNDHTELK